MTAAPLTEGIKYAGSKLKILPYILGEIHTLPEIRSVMDGFSGTTRVSQALYQSGFNLVTNDVSVWSEVFAKCYLLADKPTAYYQEIIDHLNALQGVEGWFTQHYGGVDNEERKFPFQRKNTLHLDAIRQEIDSMNLPEIDRCVALTSLILALDHVDSTLGHYVSYLADWSPRSYNDLFLKVPHIIQKDELRERFGKLPDVQIFRDDIFNTLKKAQVDLAYFDPPYGSNNEKMPPSRVRYASYYHLWTTVILNDEPELFGSSLRREDTRDGVAASPFEEFRTAADGHHIAMDALERLIREARARYVLLSYSSGGRATKRELLDILNANGTLLNVVEIDYRKNVMATMKWTGTWASKEDKNLEYLFLLEK